MIDRLISHIRRTVESQYNKNEKKKKDKNRKKKKWYKRYCNKNDNYTMI